MLVRHARPPGKSGLIEREPNPQDRRGILVVLLKSSAEKVGPWLASARQAQQELVSSYMESELEVIADFLERSTVTWEEERKKLGK